MNTLLINNKKKELNLTNNDLAKMTGISLSTISKICSGHLKTTSHYNLSKISKVLNCTIDDLTKESEKFELPPEEKVRIIILERFGSINKFSEVIGLQASTVSRILREGFGSATLEKLSLIFKELNLSLDTLLYRKEKQLNKSEQNILDMLENLNDKGLKKVEEYVFDIGMIDNYKKIIIVKTDEYEFQFRKDSSHKLTMVKTPTEELGNE